MTKLYSETRLRTSTQLRGTKHAKKFIVETVAYGKGVSAQKGMLRAMNKAREVVTERSLGGANTPIVVLHLPERATTFAKTLDAYMDAAHGGVLVVGGSAAGGSAVVLRMLFSRAEAAGVPHVLMVVAKGTDHRALCAMAVTYNATADKVYTASEPSISVEEIRASARVRALKSINAVGDLPEGAIKTLLQACSTGRVPAERPGVRVLVNAGLVGHTIRGNVAATVKGHDYAEHFHYHELYAGE